MSEAATSSDDRVQGSIRESLPSLILGSVIVRISLLAVGVFALLYSVPAVPLSLRRALSTNVAPILFLSLSVLACWKGLRSIPAPSSVAFWRMIGAAYFFWLVIRSILPYTKEYFPLASGVGSDLVYALYYLTMILAIEIRPHLHRSWPLTRSGPSRGCDALLAPPARFTRIHPADPAAAKDQATRSRDPRGDRSAAAE